MGYIQVDQGVITHRKTLRLARLLGEDRYTITGRLVALWSWCLDSALSGSLADIEPDILADVMGYPGKPGELLEALITVGFLDFDATGRLQLHGWSERMGELIRRRGEAKERMRRLRSRRAAEAEAEAELGDRLPPDSCSIQERDANTRVNVTRTLRERDANVRDKSIEEKSNISDGQDPAPERANTRARASETPAREGAVAPALAATASASASASASSVAAHAQTRMLTVRPQLRQSLHAIDSPLREPRTHEGASPDASPDASLAGPVGARAVARAQPRAADLSAAAAAAVPLPRAAAALPPPPAVEPAPSAPTSPSAKPPRAARPPDVLWDACVAAMGYSPANPVERGKWNKGLAALRSCDATPQLIAERCAIYRARFGPSIPLNPMSLAGNWTTLGMSASPASPASPASHGMEVSHHATSATAPTATTATAAPVSGPWRVQAPGWGRASAARSGGRHADRFTQLAADARAAGLTVNELMDQRSAEYEREQAAYRHKWWPDLYPTADPAEQEAIRRAQPSQQPDASAV